MFMLLLLLYNVKIVYSKTDGIEMFPNQIQIKR